MSTLVELSYSAMLLLPPGPLKDELRAKIKEAVAPLPGNDGHSDYPIIAHELGVHHSHGSCRLCEISA